MRWRRVGGEAMMSVLAVSALFISLISPSANGMTFREALRNQVAGGCVRPLGRGSSHAVFYGVEAVAKTDTTEAAIVTITPHDEARRWCALSFVIDEATNPITVRIAFLKKATLGDETLVKDYLETSDLFDRVWILPKRVWVPTMPGT